MCPTVSILLKTTFETRGDSLSSPPPSPFIFVIGAALISSALRLRQAVGDALKSILFFSSHSLPFLSRFPVFFFSLLSCTPPPAPRQSSRSADSSPLYCVQRETVVVSTPRVRRAPSRQASCRPLFSVACRRGMTTDHHTFIPPPSPSFPGFLCGRDKGNILCIQESKEQ
jgi:hypothetical protein